MEDNLLEVRSLSKKFCLSLRRSMYYGTVDFLKDLLSLHSNAKLRKKEFWSLKNINFDIKRGENVGLIGHNGSGKSTLLRIISGIFPPTSGSVSIYGRIGALISVGAGFHPHMTGRENITINGTIIGMTKKELKQKIDQIIEFAEIGEFIDSPVATYSSGMVVRLGFAIAINANIDLLLADEILAVGDYVFQAKCFQKIAEIRKNAATILVSHNLNMISNLCSKTILLHKGEQVFFGDTKEGIQMYESYFKEDKTTEINKLINGTDDFKIINVSFSPPLEHEKIQLSSYEELSVLIEFESLKSFKDVDIVQIINVPSIASSTLFQGNNKAFNKSFDIDKGKGSIGITIQNLAINNLIGTLNLSIWANNKTELLFYWTNIPFFMKNSFPLSTGLINLPIKYQLDYH